MVCARFAGRTPWRMTTAACPPSLRAANPAYTAWVLLLFTRVGVGIGEAGGAPATVSVIADYFPRQRRASAMAIYGLAVPTGAFLGGSAGGYIALHWGWRAAFLIVGLPGVVPALLQ